MILNVILHTLGSRPNIKSGKVKKRYPAPKPELMNGNYFALRLQKTVSDFYRTLLKDTRKS